MSELEDDLVAVTEELKVDDLIMAYESFIFPWPMEDQDVIPWFSPQMRGVLLFKDLHLSTSFRKLFKKSNFSVSFNQNFQDVIELCRQTPRKGQPGTWINDQIIETYIELFKRKKAYSVEVWSPEGLLVGGLYGVISKKYLSGESMFHLESGASKVALVALVQRLEDLGLSFIDTQMVTPLLQAFGGVELSKKRFIEEVSKGILLEEDFFTKLSQEKIVCQLKR